MKNRICDPGLNFDGEGITIDFFEIYSKLTRTYSTLYNQFFVDFCLAPTVMYKVMKYTRILVQN